MKENLFEMEKQKKQPEENMKSLQNEYNKPQMSEEQLKRLKMTIEAAKRENKKEQRRAGKMKLSVAAAVLLLTFIMLPNMSMEIAYALEQLPIVGAIVKAVTFREYEYEDAHYRAEVKVPELITDATEVDEAQQAKLLETVDGVNEEIKKITNQLLEEFTKQRSEEVGYGELIVKSEVLATTPEYFTLKLSCFQNAASGYEENYFYTIDLRSGERLTLNKLFVDGADYITIISENIKKQMQERMQTDEAVVYWLEDEMEELNFTSITDETEFYINEKKLIVISFQEGEVAPMYMGAVKFEIPEEILADIRK